MQENPSKLTRIDEKQRTSIKIDGINIKNRWESSEVNGMQSRPKSCRLEAMGIARLLAKPHGTLHTELFGKYARIYLFIYVYDWIRRETKRERDRKYTYIYTYILHVYTHDQQIVILLSADFTQRVCVPPRRYAQARNRASMNVVASMLHTSGGSVSYRVSYLLHALPENTKTPLFHACLHCFIPVSDPPTHLFCASLLRINFRAHGDDNSEEATPKPMILNKLLNTASFSMFWRASFPQPSLVPATFGSQESAEMSTIPNDTGGSYQGGACEGPYWGHPFLTCSCGNDCANLDPQDSTATEWLFFGGQVGNNRKNVWNKYETHERNKRIYFVFLTVSGEWPTLAAYSGFLTRRALRHGDV